MTGRWLTVVPWLLVAVACGKDETPPSGDSLSEGDPATADGGVEGGEGDASVLKCQRDDECLDGLFCNGDERCLPAAPGADAKGCVAGTPACEAESTCDEAASKCVPCPEDDDLDDDTVVGVDCGGTDCADTDDKRFPGNFEICDDGHDEDCDLTTVGERDLDNDRFTDFRCSNAGGASGDDCNDANNAVHPGNNEVCNGLDDNCVAMADEGLLSPYYPDRDGDEQGDREAGEGPRLACGNGAQLAESLSDCDASDPTRHERQVEFCDGRDNDCDGVRDDSPSAVAWYADSDGDGYGDTRVVATYSCFAPGELFSVVGGDCDDQDPDTSPIGREICDGKDNDCNGFADFRVSDGSYEDDDGDGHLDALCGSVGDDCDDLDYTTYAGAVELCDLRDNDCDGNVDVGAKPVPWYVDEDKDGFGRATDSVLSCALLADRVLRAGDCADDDADIHPARADDCTDVAGVDDDCDGVVDEAAFLTAWYADADRDGFGEGLPLLACVAPVAHAEHAGDCDENDELRHPGAVESCTDLTDNDCDGLADCDDSDCDDEEACEPVSELELVSGGEQSAPVAKQFAEPLLVRVTDPSGAPLSAKQVTLTALGGSGAAPADESVTTDAQGVASFIMRAGRKLGMDTVRLSTRGARPLTVTLTVTEPARGELLTLLNVAKQPGDSTELPASLATWARPRGVWGVATARDGTLYVSEGEGGRVFRLTVTGRYEHVAGELGGTLRDGVDARSSAMAPHGLVLDERDGRDPRLYVADTKHDRIRAIALRTGVVSTLAGGGNAPGPDYGDRQAATSARLHAPQKLALLDRTLYFVDEGSARLRKVDLNTGVIDTVQVAKTSDIELCSCSFGCAIAASPAGDLFIAGRAVGLAVGDAGSSCSESAPEAIVRVAASGEAQHVAGKKGGSTVDGAGAVVTELPGSIRSLAFDAAGNLFVEASEARVRRIDAATWRVQTVIGDGTPGNTGDYGVGIARVKQPSALAFTGDHLIVAEPEDATLRVRWGVGERDPSGFSATLESSPNASANILSAAAPLTVSVRGADGALLAGAVVHFQSVNPAGTLSSVRDVTDGAGRASSTPWLGRALKSYAFEAVFPDIHGRTRLAPLTVQRTATAPEPGTVLPLVNRTRTPTHAEVPGAGMRAQISGPTALAAASDGTLYIASGPLHRVYRLTPDGYLEVLAGTGVRGNRGDGGLASSAELTEPNALVLDEARGLLYVGQFEYEDTLLPNSRIRVVSLGAAPTIDTFATGLNRIHGLALSPEGNLYVAKELDRQGDGFRVVDQETRTAEVFLPGEWYQSAGTVFNSCNQDCGIAVEASGSVLVGAMFGGPMFEKPRSPPYGYGIARRAPGTGSSLDVLMGRSNGLVTCTTDCAGAEGEAVNISISTPRALVMHGSDLYFIERDQGRIRRLSAGQLTTIMGGGLDTNDYGPARTAALSAPRALAVTSDGHVIVADYGNNEVRLIW